MGTPLRDMEGELRPIKDRDGKRWQALWFFCPKCGNHMNLVPFSDTGSEKPPGIGNVWRRVSGSTVDDITLHPSFLVRLPCGLHGWVRNGEWHDC